MPEPIPPSQLWNEIPRRAENEPTLEKLYHSFTVVDSVMGQLRSREAGVMFGRRGTGKTHAMRYLAADRLGRGDLALYLDLRDLGNARELYSTSEPLHVRATYLMQDLVEAYHEHVLAAVLDHARLSERLDVVSPALDQVVEAGTRIYIEGATSVTRSREVSTEQGRSRSLTLAAGKDPSIELNGERTSSRAEAIRAETSNTGVETVFFHLGHLGDALRQLGRAISPVRSWILLDEWSEIPTDLQPLLADMLKRAFLRVPNITVKIAAIEHRSRFRVEQGAWTAGLELASDTVSSIDLDESQAVVSKAASNRAFITNVLNQHFDFTAMEVLGHLPYPSGRALESSFAPGAVDTLVLASEGVPRDAIQLAASASAIAHGGKVQVRHVLEASRRFFWTDKMGAIAGNERLGGLIQMASKLSIDRGVRTFLVNQSHARMDEFDRLYDLRIIHLLKQGIRRIDRPAEAYNGYAVDFGLYADHIAQEKMTWRNDEWASSTTKAFDEGQFAKWSQGTLSRRSFTP